jgi:hypothetical protein
MEADKKKIIIKKVEVKKSFLFRSNNNRVYHIQSLIRLERFRIKIIRIWKIIIVGLFINSNKIV